MLPKEPLDSASSTPVAQPRIIVKLRRRADADDVDTAAAVTAQLDEISASVPGGTIVAPPSATGRLVLSVDPAADVTALAAEIEARDDVEYAEPDVIDRAQLVPDDTRYPEQWAWPMVDAPAAWDLTTGSAVGVMIGIIDSGIAMDAAGNLNHPDLNGPRYVLGTDFVDGGTPQDLNGHGTHVAGIAAAQSNNAQGVAGMNWGTPVYVCRTLDAAGNGSGANFAAAVEEIVDFAVAHGLKAVINYSGGGADSQTKRDAAQYASDHGMILCAAAGNDGGGPVIFPAAYSASFDGVICVGSTEADDTVSGFSNVGPEVNVVAPGGTILSTMPPYAVTIQAQLNYDTLSGTSMATPLVTGLCALMWSRHPGFTNKKIRDCLQSSAHPLGPGPFDNSWGHGRVDADAALRCGDIFLPTRFTPFTRFTRFSLFTPITRFSLFTPITRFTRFTPFTRFEPGRPADADVAASGPRTPFLRFKGALLDPADLRVDRFDVLGPHAQQLAGAGLGHLHEIAAVDAADVANATGLPVSDAELIVGYAQDTLRALA